uniref:Uncharacterized protein n=1 Tax=Anguilla anguilla TaxID=7936 RepID=A0A0E9T0Q5_ANGAN
MNDKDKVDVEFAY